MLRSPDLFLLLILPAFLSADAVAQTWAVEAESALDRRIRERKFGLILEDIRLNDVRDGLTSYVRAKYQRRHTAPPSGPGGGSIDRDGDQHTLALAKVSGVLLRDCELRADAVEEALKLSASRDVVVDRCVLHGGSEDALDVVRGEKLIFRDVIFIARGARAVTVKGGVSNVDFIRCVFTGKPDSGYFLELGNWTLYDVLDRPPVSAVRIDHATRFETQDGDNGSKTIRILHAEAPDTVVDVDVVPALIVQAFFAFMRWKTSDDVLQRVGPANLCWDLDPCPLKKKEGQSPRKHQ